MISSATATHPIPEIVALLSFYQQSYTFYRMNSLLHFTHNFYLTVVVMSLSFTAAVSADEAELARMGYKQELKRGLGLVQNFGVSFSTISILTGIPSMFLYGLNTGGPVVMVWGFLVVGFFTMAVGLAMAEICSAYPTSGGPYFWAAMLSTPKRAPFASWICGWFNLIGQVAVSARVCFEFITFISAYGVMDGYPAIPRKSTIIMYVCFLAMNAWYNSYGIGFLKFVNGVSILWHAIGTFVVVISVLASAPKLQPGSFVFTQFLDNTGDPGWSVRTSKGYVVMIGILMAQYTLAGFDASAHMAEETHNAAMSAPIGIIMAIGVSTVLGWFLIIGLLFSIQDLATTLNSPTGHPVAQIFLDTMSRKGTNVLMVIVIGGMHICGILSITSNSRMIYAFARDGGFPFPRGVDAKTKSPIGAAWLAWTFSFFLGLSCLGGSVALAAVTSIGTIGLYVSYGIPIALRLWNRKNSVALLWICFVSIAFILPRANPVDSRTFNYTIVTVGIVLLWSVGYWLVSARKWFKGPISQIEVEPGEVVIMDPANADRVDA